MNRNSRIQRAILINWKGMFFQPFEIDPGMTILEGANGTGKTTIMIAIYTCLIPDLNFLNFQNVTTVSSRRNEDKGLYGRIGQHENNRDEPIFSVLDIVTSAGERHLVGVQLIKKTYPQIGLKHFAVCNLAPDTDLNRLLLRHNSETNQQEIPELNEIGDACQQHGAELISFRHAKDYFQFLFEKDISPIRLIENEERKKYNQLLHTSLYGGLSRSLQTSLRDYLLPENDRLVQGIQEMEQNLKTCRRTRSAIQRYQSVREVIRQVYDIGLDMYASALYATRLEAEQKLTQVVRLRLEKRELKQTCRDLSEKTKALYLQQTSQETALEQKKKELDLARQRLNRCTAATKIKKEFQIKQDEYQAQLELEKETNEIYQQCKSGEDRLQEEQRQLNARQMELAKQLSDAGKAWQELSKQVGLYQQAEKLLSEAQSRMGAEKLTPESVTTVLQRIQSEHEQAKADHQKLYFELSDAKLKQEHFSSYLNVLCQITGEQVSPDQAGKKATQMVSELTGLQDRVRQADQIPTKIGQLKETIRNQGRLSQALEAADLTSVQSLAEFDTTRETILTNLKEHQGRLKAIQDTLDSQTSQLRAVSEQMPGTEKQLAEWDRFRSVKKELENRAAISIDSSLDLSNFHAACEEQLQQLNLEKYDLRAKQKHVQRSYQLLLNEKSTHPDLKKLVEQGYGSLLADRYEEIPADWAANLESRLGPLVNSLVVKNIHQAANELAGSFDLPDDLWLVEESSQEKMPEAVEMNDSILVKHGDAWRLSRLPVEPLLGKKARTRQIERLGQQVQDLSSALEENDLKIKGIKENQLLANQLSLMNIDLNTPSPLKNMKELASRKQDIEESLHQLKAEKARISDQIAALEAKEDVLRQFYPLRELLDQHQLKQQLESYQQEWDETQRLQALHQDKYSLLAQLKQGLDVLQAPVKIRLDELSQQESEARMKLDEIRNVQEILERLDGAKEHFQYREQVTLLEREKSINRHTETQLSDVENRLAELSSTIEQQTNDVKKTADRYHAAQGKLNTLKGQLDLLQENLSQAGASGAEEDLKQAAVALESLKAEQQTMDAELGRCKEQCYQLEAELKQLSDRFGKKDTRFGNQLAAAKPFTRKWSQFRSLANNDPNFNGLLAEYKTNLQGSGKQSELFWRKVSTLRVTLLASLEKIHDARTVLERIKELMATDAEDANQAETTVKIWQEVRQYIKQVIPVDLQTTDPEKAQEAIGDKLESLEQNLTQQEHSLRIHVQSIPSHLNAEIRKQKSRIRKLNEKLDQVRFGFLNTIRIHIETQPKLKRFLDILPQQLDIFAEANQENVSIETLMADLYEKEGAGKVRGDLLMDYRHYVRLSIEVKREGNREFEKVTSTNLSTGESIGVGIAILIMVLMSWEEQSHFAQDAETRSSLRFLLLDESSRLDQNALHTLTDFCHSLGLQLLIAAPSVERTLKGTTHHLTRSHFNGVEEVVVRGRRVVADQNTE